MHARIDGAALHLPHNPFVNQRDDLTTAGKRSSPAASGRAARSRSRPDQPTCGLDSTPMVAVQRDSTSRCSPEGIFSTLYPSSPAGKHREAGRQGRAGVLGRVALCLRMNGGQRMQQGPRGLADTAVHGMCATASPLSAPCMPSAAAARRGPAACCAAASRAAQPAPLFCMHTTPFDTHPS